MTEPLLRGVCPIIATPFTDGGEVDYDSLRSELRALADGGCHAAILFGVVSEFFKLADGERERLVEVCADELSGRETAFVVSVTHDATEVATGWARDYEAAGADALMVFPPSFLDPPAEGVYDHLVAIGEAVSIPVMVQYRRPENPPLAPSTLARLNREVPNVEYFKIETDATGPYISALLEEAPGAHALVGNAGYHMIDSLDRGGVGVIPAAALFEIYLEIYDRYTSGDREGAIRVHDELVPALNQISAASIPYEKAILAERGIIETGYCRKPVHATTDAHSDDLLDVQFERVEPLLEKYAR